MCAVLIILIYCNLFLTSGTGSPGGPCSRRDKMCRMYPDTGLSKTFFIRFDTDLCKAPIFRITVHIRMQQVNKGRRLAGIRHSCKPAAPVAPGKTRLGPSTPPGMADCPEEEAPHGSNRRDGPGVGPIKPRTNEGISEIARKDCGKKRERNHARPSFCASRPSFFIRLSTISPALARSSAVKA